MSAGSSVVSIAPSCIRAGHDGALEQVAAVLREDDALAGRADLVAGPADRAGARGRPLVGLSTWMTRSTAPMSMPSSSELVATRAGRRPALSSSSMATRCSRAMRPVVGPDQLLAGQFVEPLGEPLREAAAVDEDDRAAVARGSARGSRGWIAGQMLIRRSGAGRRAARLLLERQRPRRARLMSSTGTTTWRSSGLRAPASTIVDLAARARRRPRKRPIASSGRCVAERPIRWGGGAVGARRRSRRSRLRARWAPRFVPAIAWTSSTITCSTPRSDLAGARW